MKNKFLIGGVLLLGLIAFSRKKEDTPNLPACDGNFFIIDNSKVCEDLLPSLGYVYWKGGKAGSGWYKIEQFENQFNLPPQNFRELIQKAAANTMDSTNPQYQMSMTTLNTYFIQGTSILKQA